MLCDMIIAVTCHKVSTITRFQITDHDSFFSIFSNDNNNNSNNNNYYINIIFSYIHIFNLEI